jgi:transcriptional regulator with XRE-family HTH domain
VENDKNSLSPKFRALIRETSVYKYYVELKEDALTEQGFFDLLKIHDLRVADAGQFLKELRRKKGLRQIDIAKILNVSRNQVNHWENNHKSAPLQALVKIAEIRGISKEKIYSLIDKGLFKTKTRLPVKFEKIRKIIPYFSPQKSGVKWQITVINCSDKNLSEIKATLNVQPISLTHGKRIRSKELYTYLTAFFLYTKVPKIQFPLTNEVKLWHENGVDLKRAIICPCLQSDGAIGEQNYRLRFCGKNKTLHDYFVDAMFYEYDEFPTSYFKCWEKRRTDCYATEYVEKQELLNEIKKLAGNAKTKPATGQTINDFLSEPQPHLNYLAKATDTERRIAIRIWASTEGSISLCRIYGYFYPVLGISCAHPDLVKQLQQIARRFHINFTIRRIGSYWSGIQGLYSSTIVSCINFLRLGGFIKGVKIGGNSKYHKDIDKDVLTLGILEFKKREKTNPNLRNLSLKSAHEEINKIIKNREYSTANYYIYYFS